MSLSKGYYFALLTAMVSGVSVFLNKFAVDFWKNSSVFTSAKNILVALILSLIILAVEKHKLSGLSKKNWINLVLLGLIGGSVPFLLFFKGLSLTSSANGAFIHKTMFLWVAVFAYFILKEKFSSLQLTALAVLGASVAFLGIPSGLHLGYGEVLILLATLLWSAETIFVQKYMKEIPAMVAAWARMFFGSLFLLGYLAFQGTIMQVIPASSNQWLWIFVSSAFLFAYVTSFYSAIKHASATVASSVLVFAAPITIMLNYYFVTNKLPSSFVYATLSAVLGVVLIGRFSTVLKNKEITA